MINPENLEALTPQITASLLNIHNILIILHLKDKIISIFSNASINVSYDKDNVGNVMLFPRNEEFSSSNQYEG